MTMEKYDFLYDFPRAVLDEVNSLFPVEKLVESAKKEARDLRNLTWSSIDNDDSLDFDQIEYCQKEGNGEIRVKVAIADVDLFVPKKSKTDFHASRNATSVYPGADVFPMLPNKLSSGVSSLFPGEDRLAVVMEFSVLQSGRIRHGEVYRALVRNRVKLVYEEIGDWLEGKIPAPESLIKIPGLSRQVRLQDGASQRIKRARLREGALNLETLEPRPVLRKGRVIDLVVQNENRARDIIENFMIGANITTMNFLVKRNVPLIQRVVRTPRNWEGIVAVALEHKTKLPLEPDAKALSDFLCRQKIKNPLSFPDLSLTIVKLLGAGEYVVFEPAKKGRPIGHFGLAVTDYTHGTAPNRRYIDLVIQRLLKAAIAKKPSPYQVKELERIALHCTDRDQTANKVERFVRKAAAALLLSGRIGETFGGIITDVSVQGIYVRVFDPPVEGKIIFRKNRRRNRNRNKAGPGLSVGDTVGVRLTGLDPYLGYVDFELVR